MIGSQDTCPAPRFAAILAGVELSAAAAVAETIVRERCLLLEAPASPSRRQAYLLPALHDALEQQGQVLLVLRDPSERRQLVENASMLLEPLLPGQIAVQLVESAGLDAGSIAGPALLVTGYECLFQHIAARETSVPLQLLPPPDVVILDDAIEALHLARECFGWDEGLHSVEPLLDSLAGLDPKCARALRLLAREFFSALARHRRAPGYRCRIDKRECVPFFALLDGLARATACFRDAPGLEPDLRRDLVRRCEQLEARIEGAMALRDSNVVFALDEDDEGYAILRARELEPGHHLRRGLFQPARSVIITGEFLTIGGRCDLVRHALGVPDAAETLILPGVHTIGPQVLLIVPDGLPLTGERGWSAAVSIRVEEVLALIGGDTLALFASRHNLELVVQCLAARGCEVEEEAGVVRAQDPGGTACLLAMHDEMPAGLLGARTFSCLVLDRVPFPAPEEPVEDALREQDPHWFVRHALPLAVLTFQQMLSRFRNALPGRGAVVVLDRRLLEAPYGSLFLNGLEVTVSRDLDDVARVRASNGRRRGSSSSSTGAGRTRRTRRRRLAVPGAQIPAHTSRRLPP